MYRDLKRIEGIKTIHFAFLIKNQNLIYQFIKRLQIFKQIFYAHFKL